MDWSTVVLVVATSLATGLASLIGLAYRHRAERRSELERERRRFLRENLLRLQDVLIELARSHVRPNLLEMQTYAPGHASGAVDGGDEWRRAAIAFAGELEAMRSRLDDPELSNKLIAVKQSIQFVLDKADNHVDYGEGLMGLNKKALEALELAGERLRHLA
jgi:hypothetical protein